MLNIDAAAMKQAESHVRAEMVEGTRLTHKTDLAFALNDFAPFIGPRKYRYHPPLVSAEWGAFTPVPWGRGIIDYDDAERDLAMETYAIWARLFELHRYYSWVVEWFHLSTQVWQRIHRAGATRNSAGWRSGSCRWAFTWSCARVGRRPSRRREPSACWSVAPLAIRRPGRVAAQAGCPARVRRRVAAACP